MKKLFIILAVLGMSSVAFAQAPEVELTGIFGRPSADSSLIGFKFGASMLQKVDRLRLGFSYGDGESSSAFYGPLASIEIGTWNISGGEKPKTIGLELMGFTDIAGGFDFSNGAIGAAAILDLLPGNKITETVKVLWSDGDNMQQAWLIVAGLRFAME